MRSDTFKTFCDWLKEQYATGYPNDGEQEAILKQDEEFKYDSSHFIKHCTLLVLH